MSKPRRRKGIVYLRLSESLKNKFKVYCAERSVSMNKKITDMIKKEIKAPY